MQLLPTLLLSWGRFYSALWLLGINPLPSVPLCLCRLLPRGTWGCRGWAGASRSCPATRVRCAPGEGHSALLSAGREPELGGPRVRARGRGTGSRRGTGGDTEPERGGGGRESGRRERGAGAGAGTQPERRERRSASGPQPQTGEGGRAARMEGAPGSTEDARGTPPSSGDSSEELSSALQLSKGMSIFLDVSAGGRRWVGAPSLLPPGC